jgi:hypothetical protein
LVTTGEDDDNRTAASAPPTDPGTMGEDDDNRTAALATPTDPSMDLFGPLFGGSESSELAA